MKTPVIPSNGTTPPSGHDRDVFKALRKATSYLEKAADIVDSLLDDARALKEIAAANPAGAIRNPATSSVHFVKSVELIKVTEKSRRHTFRIDGKIITLTRVLGETLKALADDSGNSFDELTGWKELKPLKLRLNVTTGGLNSRLSRLRKALAAHPPLSGSLLRRDGENGIRFAVLRMKGI